MSWITALWSMNSAACLTLAAFYSAVWCKQRQNRVFLLTFLWGHAHAEGCYQKRWPVQSVFRNGAKPSPSLSERSSV